MKRLLTLGCISLISIYISAQSPYLRGPAVHKDEGKIAFTFQGDIWTANLEGENPSRLTIHEAHETSPIFSPDGKSIAFNSNRYGNNDIFTIPTAGGRPKRISFHSAYDNLSDWYKDELIFSTSRLFSQVERESEIYSIPAEGGQEQRISDALGQMAVKSEDGRYTAFVRGACRMEREQYSGPADTEIWLYDSKEETFTAITDNETNDLMPKWGIDHVLYFLSASSGRYNVHRLDIDKEDAKEVQVTGATDIGVWSYDIDEDVLLYEIAGDLYIKSSNKQSEKLNIEIASDYRFDPISKKTFRSGVGTYAISPNAKLAAFEIRGEVFIQELDDEKTRTTNASNNPYRDQDPQWLNDSTLLFISDRSGSKEVYLFRSTDKKKPSPLYSLKNELIRITDNDKEENGLLMSPDGKKIAIIAGRGEMGVYDIDSEGKLSNEISMIESWDTPSTLAWSPDSKWLAYDLSDLNFNSEVYVHKVEKGKERVNVSMHPRGDYSPFWSKDGSKLGFVSNRQNSDADVWYVWLNKAEWEKTEEDREEGYYFSKEDESEDVDKKKDKEDEEEEKVVEIQIDLEDIHNRLVQLTSYAGDEGSVVIDDKGEFFYFTASNPGDKVRNVFKIKFDGSDMSQLTKGGQYISGLGWQYGTLYARIGGKINKINTEKGSTTSFGFKADMLLNRPQEREQLFEEAWELINAGFYDPNFHQKDWAALKAKYKPIAMRASTNQDFRWAFNMMLGQLNASHMGLYGPNLEQTASTSTGRIGVEFKIEKDDLVVGKVVLNSPADKENSRLMKDDILLEINGQEVNNASTNIYALLEGTATEQVLLKVKRDSEELELVIRPTYSISSLLYEEWVKSRQALVDKYSKGKLGYIHIQGMNMQSFERFERELMASGNGKEGIVIDVRWNGGGWTTDYLMAVLNVKQHAYTIPRGATDDLNNNKDFKDYYPYSERLPLSAWTKPSVAMCNESSYSNAEIFSHAYKTLDIGTLVGTPTFGAVISTGGAGLIDGSFIRMPFRAWYVKSTEENMENGPAVPDVLVDNEPDSKAKGEDPQLEKAVKVLLKEID